MKVEEVMQKSESYLSTMTSQMQEHVKKHECKERPEVNQCAIGYLTGEVASLKAHIEYILTQMGEDRASNQKLFKEFFTVIKNLTGK